MTDNVTQLDPHRHTDGVIERWPIGNVSVYTKAEDTWTTRDVDAVLNEYGEHVQIGDLELDTQDASRLANLILAALTTLQRNVTYGKREGD